eukprot:1158471-Pelagomonas_calceolata.AAC.13
MPVPSGSELTKEWNDESVPAIHFHTMHHMPAPSGTQRRLSNTGAAAVDMGSQQGSSIHGLSNQALGQGTAEWCCNRGAAAVKVVLKVGFQNTWTGSSRTLEQSECCLSKSSTEGCQAILEAKRQALPAHH